MCARLLCNYGGVASFGVRAQLIGPAHVVSGGPESIDLPIDWARAQWLSIRGKWTFHAQNVHFDHLTPSIYAHGPAGAVSVLGNTHGCLLCVTHPSE